MHIPQDNVPIISSGHNALVHILLKTVQTFNIHQNAHVMIAIGPSVINIKPNLPHNLIK